MASDGPAVDRRSFTGPVERELGVEGAVVQLGDLDALELHLLVVEHLLEQVVGHRAGRVHALQGVHDRRGLGRADEDRQVALAIVFA